VLVTSGNPPYGIASVVPCQRTHEAGAYAQNQAGGMHPGGGGFKSV